MALPTTDVAAAPVDRAIARLRDVYRRWNRDTSIAQMRSDWDAAFGGTAANVICERVDAAGVPSEWISPVNVPQGRAVLYFHGGGFRVGSVESHRDLISHIALAADCRVLAINYRLAPEHAFPAALDDALAAYDWMISGGLDSSSIAFAGDSAGGNLALAAMLALRARKQPLPAAAVLMSPWTDLAASGASYISRAEADPIHQRAMILALARNYLGAQGDPKNPMASPLFADLTGLPPLLIQVGDRETVLDDSVMLAEKAKAAGVDVDLQIWDGMIHVFQMFGAELTEAHQAVAVIGRFLDRHLHAIS